jgi:hypothetical protein
MSRIDEDNYRAMATFRLFRRRGIAQSRSGMRLARLHEHRFSLARDLTSQETTRFVVRRHNEAL